MTGLRVKAKDRSRSSKYSCQLTLSIKPDLLDEFETASNKLGLTPQQLLKYMILTSLKYPQPEDMGVVEWVRGQ